MMESTSGLECLLCGVSYKSDYHLQRHLGGNKHKSMVELAAPVQANAEKKVKAKIDEQLKKTEKAAKRQEAKATKTDSSVRASRRRKRVVQRFADQEYLTPLEKKKRRRQAAKRRSKPVPSRPPPDLDSLPQDLKTVAVEMRDRGYSAVQPGLTKDQTARCRKQVYDMFVVTMDTIRRLDLYEKFQSTGFSSFKLRHTGRYDMQIKEFEDENFNFLRSQAPWLPYVNAVLGPDATLENAGVMLSLPGSITQPWHSDGDHLYKKHATPYAINVFVPLVNLTKENGGTELVPTSHVYGQYDVSMPSETPLGRAGEFFLFDFRLRHRGLGNKSQGPRPVMYMTYCLQNFKDTMNFSSRRYLKLPQLKQSMSRSARLQARNGCSDDVEEDTNASLYAYYGNLFDDHDDGSEALEQAPTRTKQESMISKVRAERIKHRELAQKCKLRVRGVPIYQSSPILGQDRGKWYAAIIADVNEEAKTIKVHFPGWSKKHDFTCDFDSPRIKPAPRGLIAQQKRRAERN